MITPDDLRRVANEYLTPDNRAVVVVNSWMWAHGDDPNVRRLSRLVASPTRTSG